MLLAGQDIPVATWTWHNFKLKPMMIDGAYGLIVGDNIVGSIIYQHYNGFNVDFSYYGPNTLTLGLVRQIAGLTLARFNVERMTTYTPATNQHLIKWWKVMRAEYEGECRRFYGRADVPVNTAVRMVMFKEALERLANRQVIH